MNANEFMDIVAMMQGEQSGLLNIKGNDYTQGDADRLINFKRIAAELGVSPLLVWWVYFKKHIDAIAAYVKTGKIESEPLYGRFIDAQNYLYLGWALEVDDDKALEVDDAKAS
jgi:hypothetical protein